MKQALFLFIPMILILFPIPIFAEVLPVSHNDSINFAEVFEAADSGDIIWIENGNYYIEHGLRLRPLNNLIIKADG